MKLSLISNSVTPILRNRSCIDGAEGKMIENKAFNWAFSLEWGHQGICFYPLFSTSFSLCNPVLRLILEFYFCFIFISNRLLKATCTTVMEKIHSEFQRRTNQHIKEQWGVTLMRGTLIYTPGYFHSTPASIGAIPGFPIAPSSPFLQSVSTPQPRNQSGHWPPSGVQFRSLFCFHTELCPAI